jgi:hypothetical protein
METLMKNYWIAFAAIVTAALISLAYAQATDVQSTLPAGWLRTGNAAQSYDMNVQPAGGAGGSASAVLKSRSDAAADKFGTLMQQFQANEYRGQSVRFSAKVRAKNVTGSGALWMRVDDQAGKITAFDNMMSRRVVGSTDWKQVEIVLPVAVDSQTISFGVMLVGKGEFAMTDVAVNPAPGGTASTETQPPKTNTSPSKPVNLDFKQ